MSVKSERVKNMDNKSVTVKDLTVLEGSFFTEERFRQWYNMLLNFAAETINVLCDEIGNIEGISFEINQILLKEVVYDAMIGLKTIVASKNNTIEAPNPFKVAAYLGYWFLRHKPIIFRATDSIDLENIVFPPEIDEDRRKHIISDIKHLNEVAVTHFLLRYIFKTECKNKPVCGKLCFLKVKNTANFYFDSFEDMFKTIYDKLKYHLTYRAISPKTIEHFLEAYTLHPYLPYTCDLWNTEEVK